MEHVARLSLVPQRLHRIHRGGAARRQDARQEPHADQDGYADECNGPGQLGVEDVLHRLVAFRRDRVDPQHDERRHRQSHEPSGQGDRHGLEQELRHDVPPAMTSVKAPTSPMKIWMPSPTARFSFSLSMKSHMPNARSSVRSKLYFRPSTRYSSALTRGPRDASRGCTMRWFTNRFP